MSILDDFLLPEPSRATTDTYRFGTVTALDPIRIRLDGDTDPVASTPVTLTPLYVGARVWVQLHGRQLVVLGVAQAEAIRLGSSVDLNTVTATAKYHQPLNASATLALNYPAALAGLLEVTHAWNDATEYIYQRYTAYTASNVWIRTRYGVGAASTWYPWKALA